MLTRCKNWPVHLQLEQTVSDFVAETMQFMFYTQS